MIFRSKQTPREPQSEGECTSVERAVQNLPTLQPRPGLKQELLANILAEARTEERSQRRKLPFKLPAFGFSLSLAGAVASIAMVMYMMPEATKPGEQAQHLTNGGSSIAEITREDEIALRKQEREQKLLQQLVPRDDGTVVGEGIEIAINDTESAFVRKGLLSEDLEANFDLYRLVQELYQNGGTLVTINGIAVEPYTKITTRGTLTEVNNRRINAPFTIKVLGDGVQLYTSMQGSESVLGQMQKNRELDINVERSDQISIAIK